MRSVWRSGRVPEVIKRKRNQDFPFFFFPFSFFRQDYTTLSASRRETWFGDVEEFEIGLSEERWDGRFRSRLFRRLFIFRPSGTATTRICITNILLFGFLLRFIKFVSSSDVPLSPSPLHLALPLIFLEFLLQLLSVAPSCCSLVTYLNETCNKMK